MSRKVTLTVEDHPNLSPGQICPVFVFDIEKKGRPGRLEVTFKNLTPEHEGRIHNLTMPLPVRPGGLCAEFFKALGQDVSVGASLALDDAKGKTLNATFGATSSENVEIVAFQPISKESNHVAGSK